MCAYIYNGIHLSLRSIISHWSRKGNVLLHLMIYDFLMYLQDSMMYVSVSDPSHIEIEGATTDKHVGFWTASGRGKVLFPNIYMCICLLICLSVCLSVCMCVRQRVIPSPISSGLPLKVTVEEAAKLMRATRAQVYETIADIPDAEATLKRRQRAVDRTVSNARAHPQVDLEHSLP